MATVSFQVIDGVDKGRAFEDLATPVTIGREEGNVIRLNDERVSRFHAKIQEDHGHVVLTDLDSTNGSTVNGEPIQLRILKPGDQITMGRSKLVFGTPAQIAASAKSNSHAAAVIAANDPTVLSGEIPAAVAAEVHETATEEPVHDSRGYPRLPSRLAPSQAAQLSEAITFRRTRPKPASRFRAGSRFKACSPSSPATPAKSPSRPKRRRKAVERSPSGRG
jgi:predicted component of type VI protein secretion system